MSENIARRLLVALGRAAATVAGGQEGDELFTLGLVEHGVLLGLDEQDWQDSLGRQCGRQGRITTESRRTWRR